MELGRNAELSKRMDEKMKKTKLFLASGLIGLFVLWTIALCFIDIGSIGPNGSNVGFSTFNQTAHRFFGVRMPLYVLTDWLGLIPIFFMFGFAVLGLLQWLKRKNLMKVDRDILLLGGYYVLLSALYLFFEKLALNYRPVLIDGILEVSYPSSTTLLALCVLPTAMIELYDRIRNKTVRSILLLILAVLTVFMVVGRLLSGVHWVSDIIGGIFLGAGLVLLYSFLKDTIIHTKKPKKL